MKNQVPIPGELAIPSLWDMAKECQPPNTGTRDIVTTSNQNTKILGSLNPQAKKRTQLKIRRISITLLILYSFTVLVLDVFTPSMDVITVPMHFAPVSGCYRYLF